MTVCIWNMEQCIQFFSCVLLFHFCISWCLFETNLFYPWPCSLVIQILVWSFMFQWSHFAPIYLMAILDLQTLWCRSLFLSKNMLKNISTHFFRKLFLNLISLSWERWRKLGTIILLYVCHISSLPYNDHQMVHLATEFKFP